MSLFSQSKKHTDTDDKEPVKKGTVRTLWEAFFENFWNFIPISTLYSLISLPQMTSGIAAAGLTTVARNVTRGAPSFGISDFFETIKKNWKQALIAGIINTIAWFLLIYDAFFFWQGEGIIYTIALAVTACLMFTFAVMGYYMWTLMITFRFSLIQIYKNSFKFVLANLKGNLVCFFTQLLIAAVLIAAWFVFPSQFILVAFFELLIVVTILPTFQFMLIQYCVFPAIKKYCIDPYYALHPDEDVDKRRDLDV